MKSTLEMIAGIVNDRKRLIEINQEAGLLQMSIPIAIRGVVSNIEKRNGSGDLIKDLVIINHTMFDAPELEEKYRSLQGRLKGSVGQCIFVKEKKAYRPFAGYPDRTVDRERISLGILNGDSFSSGWDGFTYAYFIPADKFISYWRWQPGYARDRFCGHEKMHVPLCQITDNGVSGQMIWIGDSEINAYLDCAPEDVLLFFMEASQELGVNFSSAKLSEFARTKTVELLEKIDTLEKTLELIKKGTEFKNYDLGSATKKLGEILDEASRLGVEIPA